MQLDTRAYIFQLLSDVIFFYVFFIKMDSERKNKKQILYGIVLIPFTLVLNVNYDFSVYVVLMIMLYFISYKFTFAYKGINLLLFTGICLLFQFFLVMR